MINDNLSNVEKSKLLLKTLDNYNCINEPNNILIKEDIGFCSKCNKMIALRFTGCSSCSDHFCKQHKEFHQCKIKINESESIKAKMIEGRSDFLKKLKMNKIKAGVL